jgi:hypothetical protein
MGHLFSFVFFSGCRADGRSDECARSDAYDDPAIIQRFYKKALD